MQLKSIHYSMFIQKMEKVKIGLLDEFFSKTSKQMRMAFATRLWIV